VVDHGLVVDVVEQLVDREVATQRIVLGRAEDVVVADQQIVAGLARVARLVRLERAEGRDLDDLAVVEVDVGQPEPPADDPAVAEEALDLPRGRRRPDVEVLRAPVEQQIANAAADQVGGVIEAGQPPDDLDRLRIQVLDRDRSMDDLRSVMDRRACFSRARGIGCGFGFLLLE
jgi:hypothetical protein